MFAEAAMNGLYMGCGMRLGKRDGSWGGGGKGNPSGMCGMCGTFGGCACACTLGGTGLADVFAGSEVAAGDEPGAEAGLSAGFGPLRPASLKVMLAVALLLLVLVVVLMCSPFGPILSSTLSVSVGG